MSVLKLQRTNLNKWDGRFLDLAEHISRWSKDESTKVGAVITQNKNVLSFGFNGFPQKIKDSEERLKNRELKYHYVLHAEINAILYNAAPLHKNQLYSIFTYPMQPCSQCALLIVQAGIRRVVSPSYCEERWLQDFELSREILAEGDVSLVLVD